jgi:hypothetical protein
MAIGDYGFSGLYKRQNSGNTNNDFITGLAESLQNLIIIARVTDIVLTSEHPKFKNVGEWNGIGTIFYEPVDKRLQTSNNAAKPLDSNSKRFPLINELIYIISFPNTNLDIDPYSISNYYINNISLWNHPHHNAYPNNTNVLPPSQQKDYIQTQAGSVRRITDQSTEIFLGKTFKERANIHPLLPFEGDIIHEGRWGNSIRLGSTIKNTNNNWSSTGTDGDPITIIRNGQGTQSDEGWIPVVENINNSESSIYLASTQAIPLNASSTSYISYSINPPTSPNKYAGKQIMLNSGRLVFNTNEDHILLSSAKSINLNSQESINIDTKKFITQADQIFLGKEDLATQPLMLGTNTVNLLKDLVSIVKELTNTLKTLESAPVAPGSPAIFPTLLAPMSQLNITLETLENQLDKGVLTSQRNFTL